MKNIFFLVFIIMTAIAGGIIYAQQPEKVKDKDKVKVKEQAPGQQKKEVLDNDDRGKNEKIPPGQLKDDKVKAEKDKRDRMDDEVEKDKRTFRDYDKGGKITICHKGDGLEEPVTITVSENALKAHMAHGDDRGECFYDGEVDDVIVRRREVLSDFYTTTSRTEELLEITRERIREAERRLATARNQLGTLRNRPDIDESEIKEKEQIVEKVARLVQELQQDANEVENKLERERDVVVNLRVN